jgi:hypothetical protein
MKFTQVPAAMIVMTMAMAGPAVGAERELARTDRYPVEPGARVVIDVASLDVAVRAGDISSVEVTTELKISGIGEERAEDWIARHTPTVTTPGGEIHVTAAPGRSGFMGLGLLTARSHLGIVTPSSTIPDVTTTSGSITLRGDFPAAAPLRLRTSTGDMELVGAAHTIDVRTASGDARIQVVRPLDRFFARTSSGNVTLEGGARETHVDTASGDTYLAGLSGPVEVVTSTGRITLRWDRLDGDASVKVRSTSGKIQLILPATIRPSGRLTTTGGNIRSDFPGFVNEAGDTVTLSGDGPRLEVETASGEIILSHAVGWDNHDETEADAEGPTGS